MWFMSAALLVCMVQGLQLDSQASTRRPRVTKYSRTTVTPGGSTEAATERSLLTATYRLQGGDGETCILLTVDAFIDISYPFTYATKLNERAEANTFVPNNANVSGVCKEGDAEQLVISFFKEFTLEFAFAKTPGGERWYSESIKLTYNSSARVLEYAVNPNRRVELSTNSRNLLFLTPVGKSFFCPEETVKIDLTEDETSANIAHKAQLYLRQMRLQAFMFKRDGEFGPPWHCSDSARARSETAPVAVGAALAIATAGTLEADSARSLLTATYRLQGGGGETCILLTVDALIVISYPLTYVTKLNERAEANIFVPINANVGGVCMEGDAEQLVISFKEFTLEFAFAKIPGGERWYSKSIKLTYNSSARILEHAAKQGRRVVLSTNSRNLLFPTPVGKSFFCPEETVIDLTEDETSPNIAHKAQLYLRQMRLQAFMFKRDGEFGPPSHCSDSARARSETAPVAVGAALAIATAGTLICYAI